MELGNKRIIVVGAGASGKDQLKQRFIKKGFKPSVSFTTRPPREGEIDGKDYYFVSERKFLKMAKDNEFYEWKEFRGWYYGTHKSDFELADIFIMTPPAIEELDSEIRNSSIVIYINIDETIRGRRLRERNDSDSVKRRLQADREMFEYFSDFDLLVTSPSF